MYREFERQLNQAELSELNQILDQPPVKLRSTFKWCAIWVSGIIVSATLMNWLVNRFPTYGLILAAVLGVFGLFCFAATILLLRGHIYWANFERRFEKETRPKIEDAIRFGVATVKDVGAAAVVVIEPFEVLSR